MTGADRMARAWFTWVATWTTLLVAAAVVAVLQQARNGWLVFAASILVLTAILHSVLGERFILQPLSRRENLPVLFGDRHFFPRTLRIAWHLFSIVLVGLAAVLVAPAAEDPSTAAAPIISVTAAACAVVAVLITRGRHLVWAAFTAVAIAAWLGG